MELLDFIQKGTLLRFEKLRPLQKILLIRQARDGHERAYVGSVAQLRKPNAYVVDLKAEIFFEDGRKSKVFKPKEISFRNSSDIRVYLLENASEDARKRLAEQRRAYAQARRALQVARQEGDEHFSILGITREVTAEQFKVIKKKVMLQWHPDKKFSSHLSAEEFDSQSDKYMVALSYVDNFIKVKSRRIS